MNSSYSIKHHIFLILILLCSIRASAQRENNNIYLFDCTGSMQTNGLWSPALDALDATISTQSSIPGSQFTVIPFGDTPYSSFGFNAGNYKNKKSDIWKAFDDHIKVAKYTNISDVMKAGFKLVDPNKENNIYLLTDGMPNGSDSSEKVAQTITSWCGNHKNCRLFYVALTNGVINPVIKKAIDDCQDAYIVQCKDKVIPQIAYVSSDVYTNLEELSKWRVIFFSLPGNYEISATSDDPLFNVHIKDNRAADGKVLVSFSPKGGRGINHLHQELHGEEYEFPIFLQCKDKRFSIANPEINVHISDELPSKLILAQGFDEIEAPEVKWYDSFLWKQAADDQKISWDLMPIFENSLVNSGLTLRFKADTGVQTDFKAWYNGTPIKNGDLIRIEPNSPAVLSILFDHDAQTGKRYFNLEKETSYALDMVNDKPISEYSETSLRTEYSIVWNPLKTFLVWLGIILLLLLILWFAVLRRIFYPTIKLNRIEITGPAPYYVSKRIKGARKVVLTSKQRSQNIFSRLFTGEIRSIKAEQFSPELIILPVGRKRKVKLQSAKRPDNSWEIYPASIFNRFDKGSLTNLTGNTKSEIEFS